MPEQLACGSPARASRRCTSAAGRWRGLLELASARAITTSTAAARRSSASARRPAGTMSPRKPGGGSRRGRCRPRSSAARREQRERRRQQAEHEDRRDVRPVRSRPTKEPAMRRRSSPALPEVASRRVARPPDYGPRTVRPSSAGVGWCRQGRRRHVPHAPRSQAISARRRAGVDAPHGQKTTIASAAKTIAAQPDGAAPRPSPTAARTTRARHRAEPRPRGQ